MEGGYETWDWKADSLYTRTRTRTRPETRDPDTSMARPSQSLHDPDETRGGVRVALRGIGSTRRRARNLAGRRW